MKIIADTSTLSEVIYADLAGALFQLPFQYFSPDLVAYELEVKWPLITEFLQNRGLHLIHISFEELHVINTEFDISALSLEDRCCLWLAKHEAMCLLSSDKRMRLEAKKCHIEYHGILWLLDTMIDLHIIDATSAINALQEILKRNSFLPPAEIKARIDKWRMMT